MSFPWQKLLALTGFPFLLLGLPLFGLYLAGIPMGPFLEFPPRTMDAGHADFNAYVFAVMALCIMGIIGPVVIHQFNYPIRKADNIRRPAFPVWGYAGLLIMLTGWFLAWTRFEWMEPLQRSTFTPMWIGYILVVNALTLRRSGYSLCSNHPWFFLLLFPLSSLFWWFFEYLNRFVQNWHYPGADDLSSIRYLMEATISFSIVLPAVISTRNLLVTFPRFSQPFQSWVKVRDIDHRGIWLLLGLASGAGLALTGLVPDLLFPVLWISPFLIWIALQQLSAMTNPLVAGLKQGDWTLLWSSAVAAMVCGFFWEMWNYYSLAKWVYTIPYVDHWRIFEMPLLGYAGYLPFGVGCAAMVDSLAHWMKIKFPVS